MSEQPESRALATRQAALKAENAVETLFHHVQDQLHGYNLRLLELHDEIRRIQPRKTGSVCLELYACGPGCRGCPHPRWMRYSWTAPKNGKPGVMRAINLSAKNQDPILVLSRGAPEYPQVAELIREAKSILKLRARLLTAIRAMSYL